MNLGRLELASNVAITTGANRYMFDISASTTFSLEYNYTTAGSGVAAVTVWYTNKKRPSTSADTDWIQDTTYSLSNMSGASGAFLYHFQGAGATHVMFKVAYSSGTSVTYNLIAQMKG
jgi:hypothetical protein